MAADRRVRATEAEVFAPDVLADPRWRVDDPPGLSWFSAAAEESWTRDPFDRLIVAYARLRGWRLATSDRTILERLRASERVEL